MTLPRSGSILMLVRTFVVALVISFVAVAHAQRIERHVPRHDATLVAGCTPVQRQDIVDHILAAIDVGAPMYNDGDHEGCYRVYERAAREIESTLSNRCAGPGRALREGRGVAATRGTDTERAWAMRDAFDGLLEVLLQRP